MIRIEDDEFTALCEFMHKKYGINLTKKRVLIEYRLMNELKKYQVNSFGEYMALLKKDYSGEMEEAFVNRITTNYTFFLREAVHFQYITEQILPNISLSTPYHIWIAGCSSGEECYTLAMCLEDYRRKKGVLPPITIYATDVNTVVLEEAKRAIYPSEALKTLPAHWQSMYCILDAEGKTFTFKKLIKDQIKFEHHNLMQPFKEHYFNLIMCRNVLIYFDEISRMQIVRNFDRSLMDTGYIILGHAEMIPYSAMKYKYHKSSIYEKVRYKHE